MTPNAGKVAAGKLKMGRASVTSPVPPVLSTCSQEILSMAHAFFGSGFPCPQIFDSEFSHGFASEPR